LVGGVQVGGFVGGLPGFDRRTLGFYQVFWGWGGQFVELDLQLFDGLLEHVFVFAFLLELVTPVVIVIEDQPSVARLSLLCVFNPFSAFLQNLILLQVEVPPDDSLKSLGRVLDIINHGELDIAVSDDIGVGLILLLTLLSSLFVFKARLIEVYLFSHNNRLNRNQHLQQGRHLWIPVLCGVTSPRSKQTQTDLPTVIQVGVETDLAVAGRR
jgi:hypothetical protein